MTTSLVRVLEDGVELHGAAAALDGVFREGVEVELQEMEGNAVEGEGARCRPKG